MYTGSFSKPVRIISHKHSVHGSFWLCPCRFPNPGSPCEYQNGGIKKKRGNLYLLLVPLSKAFALPISVERATQKPTPICVPFRFPGESREAERRYNIPHKHLPLLCSLTEMKKLRSS